MAVTADSRVSPARIAPAPPARMLQAASSPVVRLPLAPTLRRAGRGDAARIMALCREAAGVDAPETLPLPLREALFDTPCRSWAWLAEIGGEPVGLLLASPGLVLPQGAYCLAIDALYVRAGWRRRGIGRRLQEHARTMAAELGCVQLRLADASLLPVSTDAVAR